MRMDLAVDKKECLVEIIAAVLLQICGILHPSSNDGCLETNSQGKKTHGTLILVSVSNTVVFCLLRLLEW